MGQTTRYLIFVCALSWGLICGAYALGVEWTGLNMILLGCPLMWIPGAVALVMERKTSPGRVREALAMRFQRSGWWWMAWLVSPLMVMLSVAVAIMLPEHAWTQDPAVVVAQLGPIVPPDKVEATIEQLRSLPIPLVWIQLFQGMTAGGLFTALFALGEEIGWRGFLDRAASRHGWGFWKSSLVIGAFWGFWHWPIILQGHNYPAHPVLGVLLMILFCMGLAPCFTFVTRMTGSVFAAALAHGMINATAGLPMISVTGGSDLTVGVTSLSGFAVILLVNLAMIPLVRKHQARLDGFWAGQEAGGEE